MTLAGYLASRWLTAVFFLVATGATVLVGSGNRSATLWMALPFALLVLNLVAAILIHRRLRADTALLVLHLALLALVAAVVVSRLTYLDAQAALFQGTVFEGETVKLVHGPLNSGRLDHLAFANEGLRTRYDSSGRYVGTDHLVSWMDAAGRRQKAVIGDDHPLTLNGYRIYAVRQRGLAPLLRWEEPGKPAVVKRIDLDDHRDADYPPSANWTLAEGLEAWAQVRQAPWKPPLDGVERDFGIAGLAHTLIMRINEQRFELQPGESIDLPQGRLTYMRLGTWMGYRIVYDPLASWVLASALLAIGSLAWFYGRRPEARKVLP